jgi:hypothetical protein
MRLLAMAIGFVLATITTIGAAQPGDIGYDVTRWSIGSEVSH